MKSNLFLSFGLSPISRWLAARSRIACAFQAPLQVKMPRILRSFALGVLGSSSISQIVVASQTIISEPYLQYYNIGPNNLDFTVGEQIRYGANSVVPNGITGGTTGVATTVNQATGATISFSMRGLTSAVLPDDFNGQVAICTNNCTATSNNNPANLTGPWTLTFTNPGSTPTTASTTLPLVGGEIPFVNSVTLSGTSAAPTFSWSPPAGTTVDGYRVNIYQNDLQTFNSSNGVVNTGQVTSVNLPPSTTTYTVQPCDFTYGVALADNTQYTIEISALQTRDQSITDLTNSNISSISRVYSNFETLPQGAPSVVLPTTTVSGNGVVLGFSLTVVGGTTYYLDPAVATGYIYQTGAGNPNFASVDLPNVGNSNPYQLYLWNGTSFVFDTDLPAGTVFDFAPGGVSEFEVLGIDPSLGLDPNNTTAFITALTFEGSGTFTGTMTPVTTDVPEPASLAILASSMLGFEALRRRRKM